MNVRQLNFAWVVLAVATALTWELGEHGAAGPAAMAALRAISFVKGRLVVLDFMGLRGVKFFWRALLLGWLLVVAGLIALAYWIALR